MLKTMLILGMVMGAVSTCSTPNDQDEPSPSPSAAQSTQGGTNESSVAPAPQNNTSRELDPTDFGLLYVRESAPECSQVWMPGAQLPGNYQWCSDQGELVAGVRMGPCEVIVYSNKMYAIPGREIQPVMGEITQDAAFLRARTSCKRNPAPRQ